MDTRSFIVSVLWIHGRSIREIAKAVQWTPGQVRGYVNREFRDTPRAHMPDETRADLLSMMKTNREDGGRLKDEHFLPIPILGKRVVVPPLTLLRRSWVEGLVLAESIEDKDRREAAIVAVNAEHRERLTDLPEEDGGVDLKTKAGRRDARQFEAEVERMVKAEQKKRAAREEGLADRRGGNASALEHLLNQRCLRDTVSGDKMKTSEEQRRLEAGMRLRKYIEGQRVGGLGAIDYERATMGSSSGPKMTASTYKLQCIHSIGGIRNLMSRSDYTLIEAVVDQDIFVWEKAPAKSRTRASILRAVRQLLDIVAVHENIMTRVEYQVRWDEELPEIGRISRGAAAAQSEAVAEFMELAR